MLDHVTSNMTEAQLQDALREAHRFVRRQAIPWQREVVRSDTIPHALHRLAQALGRFGYAISSEWRALGPVLSHTWHAGWGCKRDSVVGRTYRDVPLLRLYEGVSQVQELSLSGGLVTITHADL